MNTLAGNIARGILVIILGGLALAPTLTYAKEQSNDGGAHLLAHGQIEHWITYR